MIFEDIDVTGSLKLRDVPVTFYFPIPFARQKFVLESELTELVQVLSCLKQHLDT